MKQRKSTPNTSKKENRGMSSKLKESEITSKLLMRVNAGMATAPRGQSAKKRDSILFTAGAATSSNRKKRHQMSRMSRPKIIITSPVLIQETNNSPELPNNLSLP